MIRLDSVMEYFVLTSYNEMLRGFKMVPVSAYNNNGFRQDGKEMSLREL